MILYEKGSPDTVLSPDDVREGMHSALRAFGAIRNMLIVPPDITRFHSRAGELTRYAYEYAPSAVSGIVPALGTHCPMTEEEIETMFGKVPKSLFRNHDWRHGCVRMGEIPADFVNSISGGAVGYSIPVDIDRHLTDPGLDCILSVGQVVPHEVAGMAGFSKNIVIGLGGQEMIHISHFLGAAYGMERIMGKANSPVRKVLDYASETFFKSLPIVHAITVIGPQADGTQAVRGLYIGVGRECFNKAAELSQKVNIHVLGKKLKNVVVYLDPQEFKSTWLGNKSIYRTRMAVEDGGRLVVLAPGVRMFGEDSEIDGLVRKFGYKGTPAILQAVKDNAALKNNLSAAAHLIHGSSEGRFSITYCTQTLTKEEIEGVGFEYAPVNDMLRRYDPRKLIDGYNRLDDGEEFFYISKPGAGLWAWEGKFK
jgi:nickel-dependent lactate racemase